MANVQVQSDAISELKITWSSVPEYCETYVITTTIDGMEQETEFTEQNMHTCKKFVPCATYIFQVNARNHQGINGEPETCTYETGMEMLNKDTSRTSEKMESSVLGFLTALVIRENQEII